MGRVLHAFQPRELRAAVAHRQHAIEHAGFLHLGDGLVRTGGAQHLGELGLHPFRRKLAETRHMRTARRQSVGIDGGATVERLETE